MKLLYRINLVLTILLSLATGAFKVMQEEADIQLFEALGFNVVLTTILGLIQVIGGILLIIPKYRLLGAYIMFPTFVLASLAVFMNKMWLFGTVSLLFILMVLWIIWKQKSSLTSRSDTMH